MPKIQDVLHRHAEPRQPTMQSHDKAGSKVRTGPGYDATGEALYTGAWNYSGTAVYGRRR